MARVVVHVMPKAEILDPQGQAIVGALGRLGFGGISDVRQGKRFELEVDDSIDDDTLAEIAESLLANTVIEDGRCAGSRRDGSGRRDHLSRHARRRGRARAVRAAGAESVSLWHADADLKRVDAVVVPGGFSYGDYLRTGAIGNSRR